MVQVAAVFDGVSVALACFAVINVADGVFFSTALSDSHSDDSKIQNFEQKGKHQQS